MAKHLVAFLVTVVVLWSYALRHPMPDDLPLWMSAIGGALIITLPCCLVCRLLTRRLAGLRARAVELGILFCLCGVYWLVSISVSSDPPRVPSWPPFLFRLTLTSWATIFLPYVATLAVFDQLEARRRSSSNL